LPRFPAINAAQVQPAPLPAQRNMAAQEQTKLANSPRSSLGYGGVSDIEANKAVDDWVQKQEGIVHKYNLDHIITYKVFGIFDGTVLKNHTLWLETAITAAVYWSVFGIALNLRWDGFSSFLGKEAAIRAFIAMFSTLIGLLLSFYTALNLGRWWNMRMGVQSMEEGCKKLVMMVGHGVCSDNMVLHHIQRYARASLFLVFAASQNDIQDGPAHKCPREKAVERRLLTQEESESLQALNPHMTLVHAETLWVWLANAVSRLHDKGLSKGAPHYCALIAAVDQGRQGVATIKTYLETPIPVGYVHLLCLMVKLHNFILTVLMALACVMLAGGHNGVQPVGMFRTSFRAFFMPFLYNAILILNKEVTDPFGGDAGDFNWVAIDTNMRKNAESFEGAAKSPTLPAWIQAIDDRAIARAATTDGGSSSK